MSPLTSQDKRLTCESQGDEVGLLGGFSIFVFVCYVLAYVYVRLTMHACLMSTARLDVAQLHMTSIRTRGNSELITGTVFLIRNLSQPPCLFHLQTFFGCFFSPFAFQAVVVVLDASKHSSVFIGTVFLF